MLGITRMAVKTGIAVAMAVAALAAATTSGDAATGPGAIPASVTWEGTLAHVCHILGTDDYGQEAIVCADLNWLEVYNEAEGGVNEFYAQGEVEAYCQDSSGFDVQCANIIVEGEFDDGYGASYTYYDSCGHQDGSCPTGRVYDYYKNDWEQTTCELIGGTKANVWAIAIGSETKIELPVSDKTYTLSDTHPNDGVNESTGHLYVC